MPNASYKVKASVPGPTGVRAKTLPGSKSQGDSTNPKQGNSVNPDWDEDETPKQYQSKSASGDGKITQGSSSIKQPPQVTSEDLDLSDDLDAIFEGADLTEEFKEKALTVFEAAVAAKVNELVEGVVAELEDEFEETKTAIEEEITEKLDQYLDYVIEQWMEENELAVEAGIKSELSENFLQGLRELFAENFVDIPEDKEDVVTDLALRVRDLEDRLNEEMQKNIELTAENTDIYKAAIIADISEGLTDTQAAKLESLAEAISFDDAEEFREKVEVLRESYFPEDGSVDADFDEDPISLNEDKVVNPNMKSYVSAISRTSKKR